MIVELGICGISIGIGILIGLELHHRGFRAPSESDEEWLTRIVDGGYKW